MEIQKTASSTKMKAQTVFLLAAAVTAILPAQLSSLTPEKPLEFPEIGRLFFFTAAEGHKDKMQKAKWEGKIDYENGIEVIRNPRDPVYKEDVFTLKEELSIGKAEGREEYMFSRLSGIAVDDEERIYALDYKEAHIKIFDRNGNYVKTVGQKGQGPGEMDTPFSICLSSQNEIVVQDLNNHRLIFFSLGGSFIRSLSTARIIIVGSRLDSRGNIIGIVSTAGPERQVIELRKFDSNLNSLFSIGSYSQPVGSPTFKIFRPELRWAVSREDYIICGYTEAYELKVFNPGGKLVRKIIKDYEPIEITQNDIEESKRRLPPGLRLDIPKHYPAYQDLTVDEQGRIFVQTWEKEEGKGYYFDVFSSEGKYISKTLLRMRPGIWKRGKLYSIEEDEDGFQVIKRYKVRWNI